MDPTLERQHDPDTLTARLLHIRPSFVARRADDQFLDVMRPPDGYRYTGMSNHYHWKECAGISSLEFRLAPGSRILDVGAGHGYFVAGQAAEGHEALGVTAYDYSQGRNPHIVVGDAHRLSILPGVTGRFDLVTSRWTLRHLEDPLACLEQMLNMTAQDGIVVFDSFHPRYGLTDTDDRPLGRSIVRYIFEHFEPYSGPGRNMMKAQLGHWLDIPDLRAVPSLCLVRKSAAAIQLPVAYELLGDTWQYQLTDALR